MVASLGNPDLGLSAVGVVEGAGVPWVRSLVFPTPLYKPLTGLTHFLLRTDAKCLVKKKKKIQQGMSKLP